MVVCGRFHLLPWKIPSISMEGSIYFHGSFYLLPWKLPSTSLETSIYFHGSFHLLPRIYIEVCGSKRTQKLRNTVSKDFTCHKLGHPSIMSRVSGRYAQCSTVPTACSTDSATAFSKFPIFFQNGLDYYCHCRTWWAASQDNCWHVEVRGSKKSRDACYTR